MRGVVVVAGALALAGCTGFAAEGGRFLQPQQVTGACTVKSFFILQLRAVPTDMAVTGPGPCTFTMLDPAFQLTPTAALITSQASHGGAQAGLINGARSVIVTYTPTPGYVGTDRFTVTVEPNDHAVVVNVTVGRPAG